MADLCRTTVALDVGVLRKIDELPGSRASHIDAALVAYLTARREVLHGATTMARDSDPASQSRDEECFLTRKQVAIVIASLADAVGKWPSVDLANYEEMVSRMKGLVKSVHSKG